MVLLDDGAACPLGETILSSGTSTRKSFRCMYHRRDVQRAVIQAGEFSRGSGTAVRDGGVL